MMAEEHKKTLNQRARAIEAQQVIEDAQRVLDGKKMSPQEIIDRILQEVNSGEPWGISTQIVSLLLQIVQQTAEQQGFRQAAVVAILIGRAIQRLEISE
jgi:hypothetical protein